MLRIAGCLATVAVVALCYAQVRTNQMTIDIEKESGLSIALNLANNYRRTADTNVLIRLAALILEPKFGANAVATLSGLRPYLMPEQITSIVVPAFIEGLQSSDPAVRRQVCLSFSDQFLDFAQPAIPALIQALEDPIEVVNAAPIAAEVLGKIGSPATNAILNLLTVLQRPEVESGGFEDASVRVRAAEAIGRIGIENDEICKHVEKALADNNSYVRAVCAQALLRNNCEGSAAARTLAELIKAEDVGVRRFAVQVIEDLKPAPASLVAALQNALNDPNSEVASAARAILNRKGR
jgi:HEAT repeat protein